MIRKLGKRLRSIRLGKTWKRFPAEACTCIFALGCVSLVPSCSDEESAGTQGKRIALETVFESGDDLSVAFETNLGWKVTLDRVLISVGAFYYYDGEPPELALSSGELANALSAPQPYAHPGHYQPGNALGEMMNAASVDLVASPVALETGAGVTGWYRSGEIRFASPAVGALGDELGSDVIVVEGTAVKGDDVKSFRARASERDLENPSGDVAVVGCVFHAAEIAEDATVLAKAYPSVWLDQVDFATVVASEDGNPVDFPAESLADLAFRYLGVTRAGAYTFEIQGDRR